MASFSVDPITLTSEQKSAISDDGQAITFKVEYVADSISPGYQVVAQGNITSLVVCAKPCSKVKVTS